MNHLKVLIFVISTLLISVIGFSQTTIQVRGSITDSTNTPLSNATVKLFSVKDSVAVISNSDGQFNVRVSGTNAYILQISSIGFATYRQEFPAGTTKIGTIKLAQDATLLGEVVVKSSNPVTIKEDTVEYKANAYKVRDGAPVEDVIKKLPGVTVGTDGQITAQGKPVARVRVNGKDFFGGDVLTATKNLPANIIDNIQVIDDYGEQARLTGIKTGEPEKIININIQKDKNRGNFGNATAAVGTEGRYTGGLMANRFRDKQHISLLASVNNTNNSVFNFNGGGRGGGARGVNFGGNERGGGGGNGITNSQSIGLNFRDQWGKDISVNGSYSYSGNSSRSESNSFQQDFNPLNIRSTTRVSSNRSRFTNQRITWNMEYTIDTMNFLRVSPYLSLSSSNSNGNGQSAISRPGFYTFNEYRSANSSRAPNAGGDINFNHKFGKRGRNFNLTALVDYSYRDGNSESKNSYANDDSTMVPLLHTDTIQQQSVNMINRNFRKNIRASYKEPIGPSRRYFIELSYEWTNSATKNIREVIDIDPGTGKETLNPIQSNHFDYQFTTNRMGINFQGSTKKFNYTVGVVSQPSLLTGQSVGKNINTSFRNNNLIPSARVAYQISPRGHSLTLTYNGSSREPNFMQLQPVTDSSNLNNIVVGNPNLRAELTRRLGLQYNKFDMKSGRSMFLNLSYDETDNKIVSSRVNNVSGTGRTVSYLNTNGFFNVNGNGSISQPFSNKKFTASLNINVNYNNNISFTDNQRNMGENWNIRPGGSFRIDFNDKVDAAINFGYNYYKTTTRYTTFTNTTTAKTLNLGVSGKNYFFKDITLGYDFSKVINYGFGGNVNTNPLLLNLYTEYRFLKNKFGTLRFSAFDLMNQNTGINRYIDETTVTDSQTNRLARYFLLSFNMRVQKFGGKKTKTAS